MLEIWAALLDLIGEGKLKPVVYEQVYRGFDGVTQGLNALANRRTWGKAVVRFRAEQQQAKL